MYSCRQIQCSDPYLLEEAASNMGESSWRLSLPPSLTWARPSLSSVKILFFFPLIFIGVELLYHTEFISAVQQSESATCCSVAQSGPTLCDPTDCSTPGFPVLHHLPELAQTHVHRVGDAMQPSCPLSFSSPPASISHSIRVFSNELASHIRWPKYWSFSFSISSSNGHSGLISFRIN